MEEDSKSINVIELDREPEYIYDHILYQVKVSNIPNDINTAEIADDEQELGEPYYSDCWFIRCGYDTSEKKFVVDECLTYIGGTEYYYDYEFSGKEMLDIINLCIENTDFNKLTINKESEPTLTKAKEEHNMNISYVLNEQLECGCNSGTIEYFYNKLTGPISERIEIMSAIDKFIWGDEEDVKKFICFDYKLENISELSAVHMMNNSMDKIYKGDCFVAMLDEDGNPSLYSITPREVGPWRKDTNGDEYYISPKTGWVYMYYDLKGRGERKNTDRIAVFNEYSKEKYLLNPEDEPKTFAVPEFVGWCFELDNIHESVEEIIKEHEKDR